MKQNEDDAVILDVYVLLSLAAGFVRRIHIDALYQLVQRVGIKLVDPNVIRSFDPVPFALAEAQKAEFDFDQAIYHDTEFNKDMEIVGLELTPFRAIWKVRFEEEPSDVICEGFDAPLSKTLPERPKASLCGSVSAGEAFGQIYTFQVYFVYGLSSPFLFAIR